MVTRSLSKLMSGLRVNRGDLSFECKLCGVAYYELENIQVHLEKSHSKKRKDPSEYVLVKGIYRP